MSSAITPDARWVRAARRVLRSASRLSLLTSPIAALVPAHWIPRRERTFAPEQCIAVAELFLFHDATLGGTHFFAPRVSAQALEQLEHDADALSPDAFSQRHAIAAGFPHASSAYFAHVRTVPARWNRLLIHDGSTFHAPAIADPSRLSTDPRQGRLTLQAVLVCSRNRVAW